MLENVQRGNIFVKKSLTHVGPVRIVVNLRRCQCGEGNYDQSTDSQHLQRNSKQFDTFVAARTC